MTEVGRPLEYKSTHLVIDIAMIQKVEEFLLQLLASVGLLREDLRE